MKFLKYGFLLLSVLMFILLIMLAISSIWDIINQDNVDGKRDIKYFVNTLFMLGIFFLMGFRFYKLSKCYR